MDFKNNEMVEDEARKSAIKQFTSQEALSSGNVKFGSSAEADGGVALIAKYKPRAPPAVTFIL